MLRPLPRLLTIAAVLVLAGAAVIAWRGWRARRDWAAMRPTLPAADGAAAPGLDARLAACAARLQTYPPDHAALAEFARACDANGHLAEAAAAYRALLVLEPAEPRWPHLLAAILSGYGRIDEALPLLRRTTVLAPDRPVAWLRLGTALLKSNASAEAAAAYDAALRLDPGNAYALVGLARCDLQEERLTAARSHLQQAVRAHPEFPAAQSLLATVFDRLGNPAAAENARRHVAHDGRYDDPPDPWSDELLPFCHNIYLLLVKAHASITDLQPAAALPPLRRALALAPDDAHVHRLMARTLFQLDDIAGARTEFAIAARDGPRDELVQLDWINFLRGTHDDAALEAAVTAAVAAIPDSAALHVEAAVLAAAAGRTEEAAGHYQRAVELQPEQPGAALALARLHFAAGRDQAGVAVLEALLARVPHQSDALLLLARHGIATGDPRTAGWLQEIDTAGIASADTATLHRDYARRFGATPP